MEGIHLRRMKSQKALSKIMKHERDMIKIYKLNKGTKQYSEHMFIQQIIGPERRSMK